MKFLDYWKQSKEEDFVKAKLTFEELSAIRSFIKEQEDKGITSHSIIIKLGRQYSKLRPLWKASRAYWTETKRVNTNDVKEAADDLELEKDRIILAPNPCPVCKSFTDNGKKIFKRSQLQKNGRTAPPIHPNCYCVAVPIE